LTPSLEDLHREEELAEREELEEIERRRRAASHLALQRGLSNLEDDIDIRPEAAPEPKAPITEDEILRAQGEMPSAPHLQKDGGHDEEQEIAVEVEEAKAPPVSKAAIIKGQFVPARLPHFG
jgi:hypothetical protein